MFVRNIFTKKSIIALSLFCLIQVVQQFPNIVETYYSNGVYHFISIVFRILFGWIPFSVGDVFYLLVVAWILMNCVKTIKLMLQNQYSGKLLLVQLRQIAIFLLSAYVIFNLFWGLNYYRQSMTKQMDLPKADTSVKHLAALTGKLLLLTNQWRPRVNLHADFSVMRQVALDGFEKGGKNLSSIQYSFPAVKPSIFGIAGNYMGYSGYYNPFSAEAQVNATIPSFVIPFVFCHEIAHQLGYAKENEASFIGFLAANSSSDSALRYSTYVQMFLYANGECRQVDTALYARNFQALSNPVKNDLKMYHAFLKKYKSPIDQFITIFYEQYLHVNQQPEGYRSYNKVILWLLAYDQKYGLFK